MAPSRAQSHCLGLLLALAAIGLSSAASGRAQDAAPTGATADPAPLDSLTAWVALGTHPMALKPGGRDSVLIDAYRSLLAVGDTIHPRQWALHGGSWLLAQAKHRGFRYAAVLFIWPQAGDSLLAQAPVATWGIQFAQDSLGCWFIVNDTTPISSCVARDDPRSPVRKEQARWRPSR